MVKVEMFKSCVDEDIKNFVEKICNSANVEKIIDIGYVRGRLETTVFITYKQIPTL